jgi:hypothetical protein
MSYKGMGTTATDIAAITTAAGTVAAQLIAAGRTGATTPYAAEGAINPVTGQPYGTAAQINPATGMPYGAIDPVTGRPYGEPAPDYTVPLVIGGLALVGIGGFFFLRKRGVAKNRRMRSRRNSRRRSSRRGSVRRNSSRSLSAIAAEIRREWKSPYFGAVPYIQAMGSMGSMSEGYGADPGREIVAYFLSNASGWRGPAAKRIKAELNAMLKRR